MDSADGPVVLYDGVCGLCNRVVQFIIARDPSATIRFAQLQGRYARDVIARHPQLRGLDSIVFVRPANAGRAEVVSSRSAAAIDIARHLTLPWRAMGAIGAFIPGPLRDVMYDGIARRRYRWFGRYDSCPIPTPEQQRRFIAE